MHRYVFVLGNAFELCVSELTSYLSRIPNVDIKILYDPIVEVTSAEILDTSELMATLGGTIKIALIEAALPQVNAETLLPYISRDVSLSLSFGISVYSVLPIPLSHLLSDLKHQWPKEPSPRYVLPKEGTALSSVVVKKQSLQEFILYKKESGWILAKTQTVQDVDVWTQREFARPASDIKRGMLPAKVARMMVNIASAQFAVSSEQKELTLLDPFCGVGTVLIEGLALGHRVIGSDISDSAIQKARKNLEWFTTMNAAQSKWHALHSQYQLFVHDVVHLDTILAKESIDLVVTEPYMGELYEKKGELLYQKGKLVSSQMLQNNFKGLEKLYLGTLKVIHRLLVPGGVIVIILPRIEYQSRTYRVKRPVDRCETLGYTRVQGPVLYFRPHAMVKREIHVFKKSNIKAQKSNL